MKKVFVIFALMGWTIGSQAQVSTDVVSIFKMLLFLNKNNVRYSKESNIVKGDSLYLIFKDVIEIIPQKLSVKNMLKQNFLLDDFTFYKIDLQTSSVKYEKEAENDINEFMDLSNGITTVFIIAVDCKRGRSYRISGFDQNDFFSFWFDFKEIYSNNISTKLSIKEFINKYKVENVDFKCLYKGLNKSTRNINKYPCLKRVNDPISILD